MKIIKGIIAFFIFSLLVLTPILHAKFFSFSQSDLDEDLIVTTDKVEYQLGENVILTAANLGDKDIVCRIDFYIYTRFEGKPIGVLYASTDAPITFYAGMEYNCTWDQKLLGEPVGPGVYWVKILFTVGNVIYNDSSYFCIIGKKWEKGVHINVKGHTKKTMISLENRCDRRLFGRVYFYVLREQRKKRMDIYFYKSPDLIEIYPGGEYTITWNQTDMEGKRVPSDKYYIAVEFDDVQKYKYLDATTFFVFSSGSKGIKNIEKSLFNINYTEVKSEQEIKLIKDLGSSTKTLGDGLNLYVKNIFFNPSSPYHAGQNITIIVWYTIDAPCQIDNFWIELKIKCLDLEMDAYDIDMYISHPKLLRPGGHGIKISNWTVPGGEYQFSILLDSHFEIDEINESDNYRERYFNASPIDAKYNLKFMDMWISSAPDDYDREHELKSPLPNNKKVYFYFSFEIEGILNTVVPIYTIHLRLWKSNTTTFDTIIKLDQKIEEKEYRRAGYMYIAYATRPWTTTPGHYIWRWYLRSDGNKWTEWNYDDNDPFLDYKFDVKQKNFIFSLKVFNFLHAPPAWRITFHKQAEEVFSVGELQKIFYHCSNNHIISNTVKRCS